MSKGQRILVAIVVAALVGGAIGAVTGMLRNRGMITVSGGVLGALGGILAARIAMAVTRPRSGEASVNS